MTPAGLHAPARPVPLTVIGGFLGAGKTTLLNAVLARAEGRRLAVLVNDFGEVSIDSMLVASSGERVMTLANGCVCCTLVNGLAQALLDVLRLDPLPDHVLVEASGVADPRRIAQVARADRAFAQDAIIVVAAADQIRSLAADLHVGDTVARQLVAADLIALNKLDLVDEAELGATRAWLRNAAPRARLLPVSHAALPCDVVLGMRDSDVDSPVDDGRGYRAMHHGGTFATRTFRHSGPVCESALRDVLDALPDSVLRAKGFVRFDSDPGRPRLVQAVGRRWTITPVPPGTPCDSCTLVVVATAAALRDGDLAPLAAVFAG